jgi:hypothetical protein
MCYVAAIDIVLDDCAPSAWFGDEDYVHALVSEGDCRGNSADLTGCFTDGLAKGLTIVV